MDNKINIGVTCVGSVVGQGIIKSIKSSIFAERSAIIGFDYFPDVAGAQWVDSFHVMPDILSKGVSEDDYMEILFEHLTAHKINILFIGIGFELIMFSKWRERIQAETGCVVVVSSTTVVETALDKYKTYLFLKENHLAYPKTWLPEEKSKVEFPAILKPRRGTGSKGLARVATSAELDDALKVADNPVVQEEVGTKDDEYTCGVVFLGDKVKSTICLKRYLKAGNTSVAIHSKETPDGLIEYVEKIADYLQPFGPANFQIRIGNDKIPKLFEINPRFSGTTGARTLFGVNEVEKVLGHILKEPVPKRPEVYGKIVKYLEEILIPDFI